MITLESLLAACLVPLAIFILFSGLDDFLLDLIMLARAICRPPNQTIPPAAPEKLVAIFIPMWREQAVAGRMLEHNLAAIRYRHYHIFVGAYPNDEPTVEVIREAESRFPNVHLALCPHDGPSSKADCLNWIFQHMLLYEELRGVRFEIVVTHDAEDLIHPDSLRSINHYTSEYDMVQVPVLALPTPWRRFTHGVYCDEFAEYQTRDVPLRGPLGGFVPSNGVGTGYSRQALEALAAQSSNRVFEPECLTEDYENGLRLHRLGFRQLFVGIRFEGGQPVATREYFPQTLREAVRQRTRWVTGIALQGWERHGWRGGLASVYWFWRDRKGLIGNPVSLLSNAIFLYGLATWGWSRVSGTPWSLGQAAAGPLLARLLAPVLCLQAIRLAVRMGCVARIYGWAFALGVPLRAFWANWINSVSTVLAVHWYARSRLLGQPLPWVKTEHLYPSREALMPHKRRLGEILVASGYLAENELASALAKRPPQVRLGEHLVQLGLLTERELYEALSLQQNLPVEVIEPARIQRAALRLLPAKLSRSWKVLPFKVEEGALFLACPELPTEALQRELGRHTRLQLRFQLVSPSDYRRLRQAVT